MAVKIEVEAPGIPTFQRSTLSLSSGSREYMNMLSMSVFLTSVIKLLNRINSENSSLHTAQNQLQISGFHTRQGEFLFIILHGEFHKNMPISVTFMRRKERCSLENVKVSCGTFGSPWTGMRQETLCHKKYNSFTR
jgi:hypothetical protein